MKRPLQTDINILQFTPISRPAVTKIVQINWVQTGSNSVCHDTTRQTSSIQNRERQVGQGHRQLSQISGWVWSCRLANHRPMHSRHHIGRQPQLRHGDMVSVSSTQRRNNLMQATACMQPTHCSNTYTHRHTHDHWRTISGFILTVLHSIQAVYFRCST